MRANLSKELNEKKRARGRPPRTADSTAKMRSKIESMALQLFKQDGYDAVSMRKLAAAVGCTPRTLYAYFENKFDILSMLWSRTFEELFDELDTLALVASNPRAGLEAVAQRYVAYWLENPETYFLVFMSGGITRVNVAHYVADQVPQDRFELFTRCLAQAEGSPLDQHSLRLRVEVLVCGLNGIVQAHMTMSGYDWADPEALVRNCIKGSLDC